MIFTGAWDMHIRQFDAGADCRVVKDYKYDSICNKVCALRAFFFFFCNFTSFHSNINISKQTPIMVKSKGGIFRTVTHKVKPFF